MSGKKAKKKASPLPRQYEFVPKTTDPPPLPKHRAPVAVSDYPPPKQLFQHSPPQVTSAPPTQTSPLPQQRPSQPRPSETSAAQHSPSSSHAQNNSRTEGPEDVEHDLNQSPQAEPSLSDEQLRVLNSLLSQPGRELYTQTLSPNLEPGTTWFGRDKGKLTRKITKIFTNKFDGAYYSWTVVPRSRQERFFIEFAKTHTWDPAHTGIVQEKFEEICQRRMKGMVSTCRTQRKQPIWIHDTLWAEMTAYWDTADAIEKSATTSAARMSDRKGLGPHKHNSGQKSFIQIEHEMVEELGRPVTLGEVFIKTHTTKDGTFVDKKAQQVVEAYQKNKESKLADLEDENSQESDGAINNTQLSVEEDNELFLLSTFTNERGQHYGIGSLRQTLVNGKRKFSECSSSSFLDLKKQLEDAHRKIEEQAACNAEQAKKIEELSLVGKFLAATDPRFQEFVAANSSS